MERIEKLENKIENQEKKKRKYNQVVKGLKITDNEHDSKILSQKL